MKCAYMVGFLKFSHISRHAVVCQRPRNCVTHKCVIYGNPIHTFSAYCSLKTIGAISTKFTYVVPPIYTNSQTKFESYSPRSLLVIHTWNLTDFIRLFLLILLRTTCTRRENASANNLLMHGFKQNFRQDQRYLWPLCATNFERFQIKLRNIWATVDQNFEQIFSHTHPKNWLGCCSETFISYSFTIKSGPFWFDEGLELRILSVLLLMKEQGIEFMSRI